jgi:hypothetical protein
VPIYWGSGTVHRDFNPKAYVHVKSIANYKEVIEAVLELSNNKKAYLDLLTQSAFRNNVLPSAADLDQLLDWFDTFVYEVK